MTIIRLLLGGLLWLAAMAGCDAGAPPLPTATDAPPHRPAGTPADTPAPPQTVVPSVQPVATVAPVSTGPPASTSWTELPVPPERDYYKLARELMPGVGNIERVVEHAAPTLQVGHRETLRLVDLEATRQYESDFVLELVTPHAYWFVQDGIKVDPDALLRSATEFEESIYPKVTGSFGQEWTPGVDGDPHLYVINAHLRGAGGYFNSADEYPSQIRPVSNEIEAIYINVRFLPPGTSLYSQVLAHELQHAVHWAADVSEETWVNEGLSELAVSIAGFPETSILEFRRAGPTSLTHWPPTSGGGPANYGAASLFMHYLTAHYGGRSDLRPLLSEPKDGIDGINAYLEAGGFDVRFHDVFRDWAVANVLDEASGPLGYPGLPVSFPVYRNLKGDDELHSTIPQYSNEYIRLEKLSAPSVLSFEADADIRLLPVDVGAGCWWSNKGDVIDSTLTARMDLRQVEAATLDYQVWYSIEENWDYAYVEVSEDGGATWSILETPLTSSEDPLDVSFGPGYTGSTEGWETESVGLDRWTGREIMVRFQYITDAAIHDHGLCIRDLTVSASGGGQVIEAGWEPQGFVWTDNRVRQGFMVQLIYEGNGDSPNRVLQVELDSDNRGSITLDPDARAKRVIAVVQPVAPSTRVPANYTLRLEPAG